MHSAWLHLSGVGLLPATPLSAPRIFGLVKFLDEQLPAHSPLSHHF